MLASEAKNIFLRKRIHSSEDDMKNQLHFVSHSIVNLQKLHVLVRCLQGQSIIEDLFHKGHIYLSGEHSI